MCLDFCARVIERDGDEVVVEGEGVCRRASTLLVPDVAEGDWVRVAIGSVIERLDATAAYEINSHIARVKGAEP